MSNHFSDPNLVPDSLINRLTERIGATGRFPEGKLGQHDEGEIAFAVAADPSLRPGAGMGWCGCDPEASCEQA